MNRALFIDVACLRGGVRENEDLGKLAAEYLPVPVVPDVAKWERLDRALSIDLSASWLIAGQAAVSGLSPRLTGRLAGCVAVGAAEATRCSMAAPNLSAALSLVRRLTLKSRVLVDYETIGRICRRLREAGRRIVFTNGVFDLFHLGHLRMLEAAAKLGDVLIVGVNSDESAARLKGRARPVMPQFARAAIVAGTRWVDWCVVFSEDTPRELLRIVRPHVLVKGGEYRLREVVGARLVRQWGGEVVLVPHVEGVSTSSLLARIQKERRLPPSG